MHIKVSRNGQQFWAICFIDQYERKLREKNKVRKCVDAMCNSTGVKKKKPRDFMMVDLREIVEIISHDDSERLKKEGTYDKYFSEDIEPNYFDDSDEESDEDLD